MTAAASARPAVAGLLVSDVDSTFLTQEVIELVAEHAEVRDRVEEITTAAMRGELDFSQSLRARVALLEGLEESVLAEVRAVLVPTPGVLELVSRAKADGWIVALVSGGFHEVIDELAAASGIDHVLANRFRDRGRPAHRAGLRPDHRRHREAARASGVRPHVPRPCGADRRHG